MYEPDSLYHHGIKGQKWGVRRTKSQLGYPEGASAKRRRLGGKKIENRKIRPEDMSDQELNDRLNRLRKENEYKNLTASPLAKAGKRVVQAVLVAAALEVSKNLASDYIKKGYTAIGSVLARMR